MAQRTMIGPERTGRTGAVRPRAARGPRGRAVAAAAAAGLALAGGALAVTPAGAASRAPAKAASWKVVKTVHGSGGVAFTAVTAAGRSSAWAFEAETQGASRPVAWRLARSGWGKVSFPGRSGEQVVAAGSSSASNVWAITSNFTRSRALRWNGHRWSVRGSFRDVIDDVVVLSPANVWAFGSAIFPGRPGTWHYNGHSWKYLASGHGLTGGSALSSRSIWAVGGKSVAHWNGHSWSRTSVASLLPSPPLSNPHLTGIFARSAKSVWAVGTGGRQDEGGPVVVLRFNGHHWSRAAINSSVEDPIASQVIPDGRNDLWIPIPSIDGRPSSMLRYSGGHLRAVPMPVPASKLTVQAVAAVPGTARALGAGDTYRKNQPGVGQAAVILEFS
jgi:hypothetical protein